ncbi:MAG: glycoside hydrolase family 3 C-terminal domain-containing protein [Candidatus Cloacimonetes bacterium]|nr:glycoside hydrolase family 3 C-terminal domain-containing protein [Candidatus Cloacimonadota bacterium]
MSKIEKRIDEIMNRMNLDQKVGQIVQPERMFVTPEEVKQYHIGSVLSGGGSTPGENRLEDWVDMNDAYWAASMDEDENHIAIPLVYGVDAIHGNTNVKGSVVFPHNIGLGAANDPDLLEKIAQVTAKEIVATSVDWTFAPTIAVARNDHWGRTYESYSETPDLVSKYAPRFVKGLQGKFGDENVIACVKHWIGDGATLHGIDQGDTCITEEELRKIHMPPYKAAIDAGVQTVMVSLSSWNQEKLHGSKYLITEVLKKELGFEGFVVSDWDGIGYLNESFSEAVALSVNAGIDMFMVTEKWREFIELVKEHIASGRIAMERLDDAVRRILRVKLVSGLFERPRPSERKFSNDYSAFGSESHREVAREAVRKSLVLLKNDENILPLSKDARILVAGKNADNRGHQCGGFTIAWQGVRDNESIIGGTSIWEGIHDVAPNAELSIDGEIANPDKHDVAIVVIGETPYAEMLGDLRVPGLSKGMKVSRGSTSEDHTPEDPFPIMKEGPYGTHLYHHELHPEDIATIRSITSKGIPVVTVMVCGRPLVINDELDASKAFAVAWLPGSEGNGVADVIFGDYNFNGKLSFSWPRYDNDNWNLGDEKYNPLFPYGFGLRYL